MFIYGWFNRLFYLYFIELQILSQKSPQLLTNPHSSVKSPVESL